MDYTKLTLNPWRRGDYQRIYVSADGQELGNLQFTPDGRLHSRWYETSAHQDVMDAVYRTYAELERLGIIPTTPQEAASTQPSPASP